MVLAGSTWRAVAPEGGDGGDAQASARLRRRAATTAIAALAGFALVWFAVVLTLPGHVLDDVGISLWDWFERASWLRDDRLFRWLVDVVAVVGTVALGVTAWRRGPRALAIAVGIVFGGTGLAELLKHVLLERPKLTRLDQYIVANSFPSGHTALVTSVVLAALVVAPLAMRRRVATVGAVWMALQGFGVIAAGWHRPSDVVGAYLIAASWSAGVVWLVARNGWVEREADVAGGLDVRRAAVVYTVVVLVSVAAAVLTGGAAALLYAAWCALFGFAGVGAAWWFAAVLGGWELPAVSAVTAGHPR